MKKLDCIKMSEKVTKYDINEVHTSLKIPLSVPDKTLKCIRGVELDNRKVLCAPRPKTKDFERFFFSST